MAEFNKRILIGFIGIPFIVVTIYLGGPVFLLFIETLIFLGLLEYFQLAHISAKHLKVLTLIFGLLLGLALFIDSGSKSTRLPASHNLILTLYVVSLAVSLVFRKNYQNLWQDVIVVLFGIMYFSWNLSHLLLIREEFSLGREYIFFLFMVIWAVDTGAYGIGVKWGKRKLAPRLSPHKSWEGACGGTLCGLMSGAIVHFWFLPQKPFGLLLLIAGIISIVAQISDLSESALKRIFLVKDSGNILPGHGGILDRFDSFLLASPIMYYLILFLL